MMYSCACIVLVLAMILGRSEAVVTVVLGWAMVVLVVITVMVAAMGCDVNVAINPS